MIRIIGVNLQSLPVGEYNHFTRYSDSVVAEARALRAQGWTMRAIAAKLGPDASTVVRWLNGQRRKPSAKYVDRRVKSPNHSL